MHLSDIHFGDHHRFCADPSTVYGRGVGSLFHFLTADLVKLSALPDLIVISGDLTSKATNEEFQEARTFIDELLNRFGLDMSRLVVVPGNHDVLWVNNNATLAEYNVFASKIYKTSVPDDWEIRFARHGDVFVLGIDATRLESPVNGGIGFVGRDQLQRAEELLEKEAADEPLRILVLHHNLLPVSWIGDEPKDYPQNTTLDAPTILSWAQENRFGLILHGHQHQAFLCGFHFFKRQHGPIVISGCPSLGGKPVSLPSNARNGYEVIVVEAEELEIHSRLMNEANAFDSGGQSNFVHRGGRVVPKWASQILGADDEVPLDEARSQSLKAIQRIREALVGCYGPLGGLRSVRGGVNHVRDGQKIIESVNVHSLVEQRIAQTIRSLTHVVSTEIGDGRKTSALLCLGMAERGINSVIDGSDDGLVASGIIGAATLAFEHLRHLRREQSTQDPELAARVAMTASCGNRELAECLRDAVFAAGHNGLVAIERGRALAERPFSLHVEDQSVFSVRTPEWLREFLPGLRKLDNCVVAVIDHQVDHRSVIELLDYAAEVHRPLNHRAR